MVLSRFQISPITWLLLLLPCSLLAHPQELSQWVQAALQSHYHIAMAQAEVEACHHDLEEGKGVFWPHLHFQGGWVNEELHSGKDFYRYGFLSGNWNLYRGGQDEAERCKRLHRLQVSCLQKKKISQEICREVCEAFYHILYLKEALSLYEKELLQNALYITSAEDRSVAGLTPEVNVLELQIRHHRLEAEREDFQNQLEQQLLAFQLITGWESPLTSEAIKGGFPPFYAFDLETLYTSAQTQHPELLIHKEELFCSEKAIRQAHGAGLPRLDLKGSYGYEPGDHGERSHGSKIEVAVQVPLFTGGAQSSSVRSAKARNRALHCRYQQQKQVLYGKLLSLSHQLNSLQKRLSREERLHQMALDHWMKVKVELQHGEKESGEVAAAGELRLAAQLKKLELQRDHAHLLIQVSEAVGCFPPLAESPKSSWNSPDLSSLTPDGFIKD